MPPSKQDAQGPELRVDGKAVLEAAQEFPKDVKLQAFAFDRGGKLLGSADVDAKGGFALSLPLAEPVDVNLVVGPAGDPQQVRQSSAFSQTIAAESWERKGTGFVVSPSFTISKALWFLWLPITVCVSGHVRKVHTEDGHTDVCPVPYVKVEIFDVDREGCWWPYITRWWDRLLDRPVVRIPELVKERPGPPPPPDPGPFEIPPQVAGRLAGLTTVAGTGLQHAPSTISPGASATGLGAVAAGLGAGKLQPGANLNPQPEPPGVGPLIPVTEGTQTMTRIGEVAKVAPQIAARLEQLTLTSKIAPWVYFLRCFYSRQLVCTTTTDANGFFKCCFTWWPFHIRLGRLRFDSRPDIIVKVTQVIDGVETVVYMDPYTSTRWNQTNAHIDLFLDSEDVQCGGGDPVRPPGSQVFLTRIGDDEVYEIDQSNGLYRVPAPPSNMAYGSTLYVYAQFGDDISDGSPARYYRLSYAKQGSSTFTPITAGLSDTRVNKITNFSETHTLGPVTVNGTPALYEVRNFASYLWYNPDWIGSWATQLAEEDTGTYILRLEVFNELGVKMTSAQIDYRDGTVVPPNVLPPMTDRCDLVITLDNKPPVVTLTTPATNLCGVIPFASVPPLNFSISVSQENGRVNYWIFDYTKGVEPGFHALDSASSTSGAAGVTNKTVDGAAAPTGANMLAGVSSTCAFAVRLRAWAHIRNGRYLVYYAEEVDAIAIEKCP